MNAPAQSPTAAIVPTITLTRASRRFASGTLALAEASLEVAEGEFVALLGPSGCGKSTLLRLVAGLDRPSAGWVQVSAGPGLPGLPPVGFVFQEPTLMPWARVVDNVALPLRLAGRSRAQALPAVRAQLAAVGLQGFEDAYPHELSGGMKMRVSIARALVALPRVLLMDEPFAALDEITRIRLNEDLLAWWAAQRLTVLFVTHSVFEAVTLAQKVVVMGARPGRVVEVVDNAHAGLRDEDWRASADFAQRCARVSQALRRAAAGHGEVTP